MYAPPVTNGVTFELTSTLDSFSRSARPCKAWRCD